MMRYSNDACPQRGNRYPEIEPGERIGRLTVIGQDGQNEAEELVYRCRCDCGNEVLLPRRRLRGANHTNSCGCLQKENTGSATKKDLTGLTIGNLKVIREAGREKGYVLWECEAPNGKRVIKRSTTLIRSSNVGAALMWEIVPATYLGRLYRRWRSKGNMEFENFREFREWAEAAGYKNGLHAVRKDKSKGFDSSNIAFEKTIGNSVEIDGEVLSIADCAKRLNISRQYADVLYKKGKLEAYFKTGRTRFARKERLLESLKKPCTLDELMLISGYKTERYLKYTVLNKFIKEGRVTEDDGVYSLVQ